MDYREQGQLTVEELIKLLETMPKDALVWSEGCDCYGAVASAEYDESDNSITIGRVHAESEQANEPVCKECFGYGGFHSDNCSHTR